MRMPENHLRLGRARYRISVALRTEHLYRTSWGRRYLDMRLLLWHGWSTPKSRGGFHVSLHGAVIPKRERSQRRFVGRVLRCLYACKLQGGIGGLLRAARGREPDRGHAGSGLPGARTELAIPHG